MEVAGRFVLIAPMRDRGLGDAWRAKDVAAPTSERIVKLHPLTVAPADADALIARLRETSAAGAAPVVGGGAWRTRLAVAYESCGGRSLRDWIDGWRTTRTPPAPETLKALFLHLCSAVGEAQQRGLAHERLNPRSVIITSVRSARPLLVFDFGVAAHLGGDDQAACADYLSPEQLDRGRRGADPRRADLFALGVILAELLTLRAKPRADGRETWEQYVRAATKRAGAALPPRPEDAPEAVWRVVERLLLHRNDPDLATPSKVRSAAKGAWESAGVQDASAETFREAPAPVEMPPAAPAHEVDRRPAPPPTATPPREAPPPPSRPAVVHAYSVDVSARAAPSPARPTPTPSAPPLPPPASPAPAASADVGADTITDLDDPTATAPLPPPARPAVGGDTLALDAPSQEFGATSAPSPDRTMAFEDEPPTHVQPRARRPSPAAVEDARDPFAHARRVGGDTLPIDDARSPLVSPLKPVAPRPPAFVDDSRQPTLPVGVRERPVAFSPPALSPRPVLGPHPGEGGDTLPLDGPPPAALIRPIAPAPAPRPVPRPSADETAPLPALDDGASERSFYLKVAVAVVLGGAALGFLASMMLPAIRH